jgi:hypothetical protein
MPLDDSTESTESRLDWPLPWSRRSPKRILSHRWALRAYCSHGASLNLHILDSGISKTPGTKGIPALKSANRPLLGSPPEQRMAAETDGL